MWQHSVGPVAGPVEDSTESGQVILMSSLHPAEYIARRNNIIAIIYIYIE